MPRRPPPPGSTVFDPQRLDRLFREGKRLGASVRSVLTPGVRVETRIREAAQLALIDDLTRYLERLEATLAELRPLVHAQRQRAQALTVYSRALNNAYRPTRRRGV